MDDHWAHATVVRDRDILLKIKDWIDRLSPADLDHFQGLDKKGEAIPMIAQGIGVPVHELVELSQREIERASIKGSSVRVNNHGTGSKQKRNGTKSRTF